MRISFALRCCVVSSTLLSVTGCLGATEDGSTSATTSSGSGSGSGSGTSSGSTTGGGAVGNCPADWLPCTPSNICDNGCSPDGGQCVDELSANAAQTGTACDAGAVCEGTTCYVTSGPQVPNQNGGVISQPNVVLMTFNDDPNQSALEQWGVWIMDGGYLPTTAGQYGVGDGTIQFVHLSDAKPTQADQGSVAQYFQQHFDSDPTMPLYTQSNVYLLFFPASWTATSSFCQNEGGYHTALFQDQSGNSPIYAVVATCRDDLQGDLEVSASHEIVEASTDPYSSSWTFYSTASPWALLGGELGDMCESNSPYYQSPDGNFAGQYIWSNAAASRGQVPCQPWPSDQVYVETIGPTTLQPVVPGTVANIPLTGWASGPTASWGLVAQDAPIGANFLTNPTISSEAVGPGEQVMAQLNIPAATPGQPALGGLVGAAWIFSAVGNGDYEGSSMVGVVVSCETSADCSNPAYTCSSGSCDNNTCSSSAAKFSKCSAGGSDDGICLPYDTNTGPVEICTQIGSLPAGATGCQLSRVVGGGPSDYCDATSICEGTNTPACLGLCTPSETTAQGSCAAGDVCIPLGQDYGFCVQGCSTLACPTEQTCENAGGGFNFCYPN